MRRLLSAFFVLAFLACTPCWAQPPGGSPPPIGAPPPGGAQPPPGDPMMQHFFPPELVMENQKALGLSAEQQASIRAEMKEAQARFTDLNWQLHTEAEDMDSLLSGNTVNEQQALAQLKKLMDLENQIKQTHFTLLVRIRNTLTPEQRARIEELKKQRRGPPPHCPYGDPRGPKPGEENP